MPCARPLRKGAPRRMQSGNGRLWTERRPEPYRATLFAAARGRAAADLNGAIVFPYWFLFTLFAAGAVQSSRADPTQPRSSAMLGIMALVPLIMIGMRYQTGADWQPYLYIFQEITYMQLGDVLGMDDPGYSLLNWIANQFGLAIWAVNLVCAMLFTWGLITFAKHQPNPWLAFVVAVPYLVIVVAMGYARQAVAIGLIMAAIVSWDKHQIVRFGLYILIAATFHKTAVLALPLVALSSSRNRLVTAVLVIASAFFLYRYFLAESVGRMFTNYVGAEYSSEGAAIRVAMNVVPAVIFLFFRKRFVLDDNQRRMWMNFALATLGTVLLLAALPSSTAVDRIALYLIPLQLFVFSRLPEVFAVQGRSNAQVTTLVIAYSALIQFVWLNYANHAEYWVPYSLWPTEGAETEPDMDRL